MNQSILSAAVSSPFYDRLQALRAEIKAMGLDGFLVPMTDEHLNEYVGPSARRIAFLSGFTGSAAFIVVLADRAAFFTDSRYILQAQEQLTSGLFTLFDTATKTAGAWLADNLVARMAIGFDPALHALKDVERLELIALKREARLIPVAANPIDALWEGRPCAPCAPIVPYEMAYAGKASAAKRHETGAELKTKGVHAAVIADPASIAWLLNVRGGDAPHTPLPFSFAILRSDGSVEWFVNSRKIGQETARSLGSDVTRYEPDEFGAALRRLGEAGASVLVDPSGVSYMTAALLRQSGATLVRGTDPCVLPRACKNTVEIDGTRAAHRRDGAALVKFLAWFDLAVQQGSLTEMEAEEKLRDFRAAAALYRGPSFDTIAGAGSNAAIVHYRATNETNKRIERGSFFLLDSGGQYLDGTTDVTRTIPVGEVTAEMRDNYTRVLKGHMALAMAVFPEGTCGADLDVLARQFLWEAGLDYGHGTGHGVGCYLGVHEGPQSISRRGQSPLLAGMIVSDEPGFYKPKHYGIRLENLLLVVEKFEISGAESKMLGFEPLTLAPFDRRSIVEEMLSVREKTWLNAYHARVAKALRPQLDAAAARWLDDATRAM